MKTQIIIALAMLAGVGIGTVATHSVDAQGKGPGAYAVIDISEVVNPEILKDIVPKAGPASAAFGGKNIIQTNNISALDGTPPKRFVVVAFESVDKAKAWYASPAQKEVDALRVKAFKSRVFIAEGM